MIRQFKALSPKSGTQKPAQKNFETSNPKPSDEMPVQPGTETLQNTAPEEIGGRGGLDPVRYGDWEVKGRCVDF